MAKAPSFPFYARDWLTDEHLVKVSFSTKGMWIDLISHFWLSETRGKTTATRRELCSMLGCSAKELRRFLSDNERHPFCDVSYTKGVYTVENRRMVREEAVRAATRNRVRRHREGASNAPCNADVTPEYTPPALASAFASASASSRDIDSGGDLNWLDAYSDRAKLIVRMAWWHFYGAELTPDKTRHENLFNRARVAEDKIPAHKESEYMEILCAQHKPQKILSLIDAFTPAGDCWGLKYVLEAEGGEGGAKERKAQEVRDAVSAKRSAGFAEEERQLALFRADEEWVRLDAVEVEAHHVLYAVSKNNFKLLRTSPERTAHDVASAAVTKREAELLELTEEE